jgi:hypothetical protein
MCHVCGDQEAVLDGLLKKTLDKLFAVDKNRGIIINKLHCTMDG